MLHSAEALRGYKLESTDREIGKVKDVYFDDQYWAIRYFERLVRQHGKLKLLFDMTNFHGWDVSALWADTKFAIKHFADIEKLAMVGEKRWQHGMATFCKPFTKATVRYFDHNDVPNAQKWLIEE